jgi:putative membrane protein
VTINREEMNIGTFLPIADTWSMHGGGSWIWMMLAMALFWGAIIVGTVWVARGASGGSGRPRKQTPLEVLDERFAEGVLSVDEYNARKEVLIGALSERSERGR